MSEAEQDIDNQEFANEIGESQVVPEDVASAAEDVEKQEVPKEPEEPVDPLTAAQREILQWKDVALRSKAELENFRKRMARERTDAARYANADLLQSLLPVLDNFEFGLLAAKAEEGSSIYLGMQMVLKQIEDFLSEQGVESIDAVGQPFDPNLHDALAQEPSEDVPEGQVLAQIRRGYRLHERLLRPAGVHVSTGISAAGSDQNADEENA